MTKSRSELHPIQAELRRLRLDLGLTMRELGKESGLSHETIHAIEVRAKLSALHTISQVLEAVGYELQIRRKDEDPHLRA